MKRIFTPPRDTSCPSPEISFREILPKTGSPRIAAREACRPGRVRGPANVPCALSSTCLRKDDLSGSSIFFGSRMSGLLFVPVHLEFEVHAVVLIVALHAACIDAVDALALERVERRP